MRGFLKYWILILSWPFISGGLIYGQSGKDLAVNRNTCLNFIHITGESNVNQFSFSFNQAEVVQHHIVSYPDTSDVVIRIPIREFKASNKMMYDDFLKLMKESDYPVIEITFKRKQLNRINSGNYNSCPETRITIAGITRLYKIDCFVMPCADNLFLQGEKNLKLTDFHLKPPVKLKGLVKVSDDIIVSFGFMITFTDPGTLSVKF